METELATLFDQMMLIQGKLINFLPNEMLRTILVKLDVNTLITIRAVCKRWQAVIEEICRKKRSIVIGGKYGLVDIGEISERFNGLVDYGKNCAVLKVKLMNYKTISLSDDFTILLAKLFPIVKNFVLNAYLDRTTETAKNLFSLLDQWSSTIVTLRLPSAYTLPESHHDALYDHIDKVTALKRLHFSGVDFLKATILSELEHCALNIYDTFKVVPLLGTSCTSVCLSGPVSHIIICQWPEYNAPLVKGLTHLSMKLDINFEEKEILSFVCSTFKALQMLHIGFSGGYVFDANMIIPIAQLSNLSQLSMDFIKMHMITLAEANLSLSSIRILSMSRFKVRNNGNQFDGDQFCRVISSIFPNVQQLTIKHRDPLAREGISQHLNHFVHLRRHVIVSPSDNGHHN